MAPAKRKRLGKSAKSVLPLKKPTLLDVLNLNSHYPICDRICSLLHIGDLVNLSRTCRMLSSVYRALLPTHWNIDRCLERFVQRPKEFRSQLGMYDALISGSFAIQFFQRVLWRESDLDIFITGDREAAALENHLVNNEGYRCTNDGSIGEYTDADHKFIAHTSLKSVSLPKEVLVNKLDIGPNTVVAEDRLHGCQNTNNSFERPAHPPYPHGVLYHPRCQRHLLEQGLCRLPSTKLPTPQNLYAQASE